MKKTLLLSLIMGLSLLGKTQQKSKNMETMMLEEHEIQQVVTSIFVGTDNRNWDRVNSAFAEKVLLDYTSMAGGEPAELSPEQITTSWKTVLPGFDYTQHAISNFNIEIDGSEATVFHYGNAQHYMKGSEGGDLWTVVGTYDHHLIKTAKGWKVDRMKLNFKYMTGNGDLPRFAQEKVKNN